MQRRRGPRADIEDRENFGYALGEARDFLDQQEEKVLDLLDAVEAGRLTFIAARLAVRMDFVGPRKDLDDWQRWWGWRAKESDFPYLNENLERQILELPSIRLVVPLRTSRQDAP